MTGGIGHDQRISTIEEKYEMLMSPKDICLGDKGERNGGGREIIVQRKGRNRVRVWLCKVNCKKAIELSGIKKVGGEQSGQQMARAVSVREGEARKEPVVGLSHQMLNLQMEPICFGSCWKLVLPILQIQKQSQDT